jgi:predicted secreted protein
MTNPIAGFGTTIKYAAGTLVGKLVSIGGIKLKGETIDITNHDSADGFKEFIAGLKDAGEFPMEGNFVQSDAGQLALMASFNTGALESFIVTFPDTSTWTFSAIVTGVEVGKADLKDQLNFSATLKISGKPVFAGVTTLRTVTFTVTAAAGGAAIAGASVVFNNETKLTDASGIAVFYNVADATYYYACGKTLYTPQSKAIVVNGTEAEAVALVLA